ncbi:MULTISPECIES: bifunctional UDP-3-O-[3-hydroxymyristoyl] N-acetylglucosamine deacetylase/3-hydroxyacyl-ACP dehydratase [unclassified Aureispira]|uniref:bifunctional UDP-3-O-[3-hydroxymyristoyl] N-acetylglucosamine deacetylase/3-hydroxyacyl-ACP dehydratase n=1 Tax=unclassified Aureispira TaxID=2649989 RepID=UPI000698EB47|nr:MULTISPECIES: bifunctional UDP-3-O-[3-hydroxymyristoyl] N-acetylglucosamine deacetylase/3-hydroxyacyl-ACP dehydratase [unclassified Aureispira]WMX13575.1 bifunctional UDP-3-O-[3-hydroxymyristoyl] N-acetylglucosamine deacetylase/3-hydroxyacyl-ACP dehydratase [Aureispira sp. CCB-E]
MKQATIKQSIEIEGKGLHTGKETTLSLHPAAANHGIKFRRIDLEKQPIIKADANHVVATQRCTVLGVKDATVSTVEHLLAALKGTGVSNVLIDIDGEEVPILDGSALPFVEKINEVGVDLQEEEQNYLDVSEPMIWKHEASGAEYTILPSEKFEITTLIDFDSSVIGKQYANLDHLEDFATEIAPNRTFVFLHELSALADAGLVKGGELDNALVFVDSVPKNGELAALAKKLDVSTDIEVKQSGILNTTELRFQNEAARHKLLDVVGDLALTGLDLRVKIIAKKPGHAANTELAKELLSTYKTSRKLRGIPKYDPNKKPVNDINEITKKLQHRFPFLLIDKIIELSDKHVVGVKNVTMNEPFFPGHFPNNPVMPGVLQIEAMAQTGGILVMENVENPHEWDTFFLRIKNALFRHPVLPGDTILFKMELISPIRRGLCEMTGKAYVGNKLVCEAELLAQIIRR